MTRTLSLTVAALLVASAVGCASKGALQEVDDRVRTLQQSIQNAQSNAAKASQGVQTLQRQMGEFTQKVDDSLEKMQNQLTSVADELKGARASTKTLRGSTDKRIEAHDARLKTAEGSLAALAKDVESAKTRLAEFGAEFKTMKASLSGAQDMLIKNLQNLRDMYKTQYLASEEQLRNLKKKPAPKPPE
jgi:chromosome segregation ATPase